jgi:hypothetical protein
MNNITNTQRNERGLTAAALTATDRTALDLFGTIYSNFSVELPMPRAYEIIAIGLAHKGRPQRNGYRHLLPFLEKLAANGLSAEQIARVLGMSESLLDLAVTHYPEVYHAIAGGRARGINEAAATITRNAAIGDTAAAKFKLQTIGGFSTKLTVTHQLPVSTGQQEAPVKSDTLDTLKVRHQAIIDEVNFQDLESV